MTRFTKLGAATVIATAVMALPTLAATYTINGALNSFDGGSTVDYHVVDASIAGTYIFDVLSRDVLLGDAADGLSGLDPFIYLFEGSLGSLGALVGFNDDGGSEGFGDGSISGLDSYLSLDLSVGSYVLAIGNWRFSESEARSGINDSMFFGSFANYRITVTTPDTATVPLPASVPLLMAGLGILGFAGRRKRK